jgi:hypothetical protein
LISSSLIGPCARLAALRKSSSGWWSVTSELLCRLLLQRGPGADTGCRGCTPPGVGGRLPVRRHHRRSADQDRLDHR